MKELDIFKKHLGDLGAQSTARMDSVSIHRFSSDLKGANEFIGALQTLDIALGKICRLAQTAISSTSADGADFQSDARHIVETCAFMGEPLFGVRLFTNLGGNEYEFMVENPLSLLEKSGAEGVYNYADDKKSEIKFRLSELSSAISSGHESRARSEFETFNTGNFRALFMR